MKNDFRKTLTVKTLARNTQKIGQAFQSAWQTGRYLLYSPAPKAFIKSYLLFIGFILSISLSLFFLAKERIESYRLGYKIGELTKEKHVLIKEIRNLRAQRAKLRSPVTLLQKNESMKLYLSSPEQKLK